jgi:hypothetical protein
MFLVGGACSSSANNHQDGGPADSGPVDSGAADVPTDAAAQYPIPTAVRVLAASAPVLPNDLHAWCIDSDTATMFSTECTVIKWGRWTYWILTHGDSRLEMDIVPFDETGTMAPGTRWPLILNGGRYVLFITVDTVGQMISITGQASNVTFLTWDQLRIDQPAAPPPDGAVDAPTYDVPTAVQVAAAAAPAVLPAGAVVSCVLSGADPTAASYCWVVKWGRWTYWAFSYTDNRTSFMIAPYDETGTIASQAPWPEEQTGARYLWQTSVDSTAQTVTFSGQVPGSVTMTWDQLRIDQP